MAFQASTEWRYTKHAEAETVMLALLASNYSGQQQPCIHSTICNIDAYNANSTFDNFGSDYSLDYPTSLKQTFLDHLAELFARSKEAHMVSSTSLYDNPDLPITFVTRNEEIGRAHV